MELAQAFSILHLSDSIAIKIIQAGCQLSVDVFFFSVRVFLPLSVTLARETLGLLAFVQNSTPDQQREGVVLCPHYISAPSQICPLPSAFISSLILCYIHHASCCCNGNSNIFELVHSYKPVCSQIYITWQELRVFVCLLVSLPFCCICIQSCGDQPD